MIELGCGGAGKGGASGVARMLCGEAGFFRGIRRGSFCDWVLDGFAPYAGVDSIAEGIVLF